MRKTRWGGGIAPRHEARAAWGAERVLDVGAGERHPVLVERIERGGADVFIAERAHRIPPLLVRTEPKNVGSIASHRPPSQETKELRSSQKTRSTLNPTRRPPAKRSARSRSISVDDELAARQTSMSFKPSGTSRMAPASASSIANCQVRFTASQARCMRSETHHLSEANVKSKRKRTLGAITLDVR